MRDLTLEFAEDQKARYKKGFYYLASPYSKYPLGREKAFQNVCKAAGALLKMGVHIYCPIAHTHPIAEYGGLDPLDHEIYLPLDQAIFKHARGMMIVEMEGWKESKGIQYEHAHFKNAGKPIYWITWPRIRIRDMPSVP